MARCHRTAFLSPCFPCEMARYIAGFPQEARKSGRFCGPKASKPGAIRPRAVPITWIRPPVHAARPEARLRDRSSAGAFSVPIKSERRLYSRF